MPKAYIADTSKFRAAVLKEYCGNNQVETFCMQNASRVLDDMRAVRPDVIFLPSDLVKEQPALIQELRSQAPLDRAIVVVVATGGDSSPRSLAQGVDFLLSSSADLPQLNAVFRKLRPNTPRALIVSPFVRQSSQFCRTLTARGFEVRLAATGGKGLKEAVAQAPQIILVDAKLVDMAGAEFCRRARELEQLTAATLFVLLAKPDSAVEEACRNASAKGVLLAPFDSPQHIEKLCAAASLPSSAPPGVSASPAPSPAQPAGGPRSRKCRLAIYWAASCGGCEMSFVNLHEKLLDVDPHVELVFCPCLMDTKKKDVEALPDGSLDVTLFNGAIRSAENEEMAHLLRRKSRILIAYGACAQLGGIPALANLRGQAEQFQAIFLDSPSVDNRQRLCPQAETQVAEGVLQLPPLCGQVRALAQVVETDYFIPGCPPESQQLWNVLDLLIRGAALPPKGSVLGAGRSSVCDSCSHERREDRKLTRLRRVWEFVPDAKTCLLEQGLLCMGIATRDGCGALCPKVNMPCIGCYGPPEGVLSQGARMVAAVGGLLDIEPLKHLPEEQIPGRVDAVLDTMLDPAGTFLTFSLAGSPVKPATSARRP
jgi:F420-non-reducing hydrogenase small subunit